MVLQKGTKGAEVWGWASAVHEPVTIYLNGQNIGHTIVEQQGVGMGVWQYNLKTSNMGNAGFTLMAASRMGNITLTDVKFGDVWLCSGQSNMEFQVQGVILI